MEEEAAPVRRNVCRCKLIGAHDETCKCYETDEIVRMRKKIKELNDHTHDGLEVFSKVTTKVYSMTKCVKLLLNFADKIIADYDKGVNEITRKLKDSINTMKSYSYKQMHDLEQKPKIPNNSMDYWKVLAYEVDVLKQGLSVRDEQLWLLMDIIKKMLGEMGDMRVKMKYLKESMDTIVTHN